MKSIGNIDELDFFDAVMQSIKVCWGRVFRTYSHSVTKEMICCDLCRVANLLKSKTVSARHYDRYGKYCCKRCLNAFGKWNNALAATGLELYRSNPKSRHISKALRYRVMERDKFRCVLCGSNAQDDGIKLHIDHIRPFSKGGKSTLDNLRTLCADCNLGKWTR